MDPSNLDALRRRFHQARAATCARIATLHPEDMVVQTTPDVSPTKWHLAHVTWWFEHFVLAAHAPEHRVWHPGFHRLFNSYYLTVGEPWTRAERGALSRPTVDEVLAYRAHVDAAIDAMFARDAVDRAVAKLIEIGIQHEQQHQELLLMDIKDVFGRNPLAPVYAERAVIQRATASAAPAELRWVAFAGGVHRIGADAEAHDGDAATPAFVFDNETPRHATMLLDFELADRLVTNREYREFVADDGYRRSDLWLSDGWTWLREHGIAQPAYWRDVDGCQSEFTLAGLAPLDDAAPVVHVSHYEADAFARWAGARLPTEAEWEVASRCAEDPTNGNLAADPPAESALHPLPASSDRASHGLRQMFGDVWEWTASPYVPYPGFRPLEGALGEYNGKFMSSQIVLRGGSCVTPRDHVRATYRNFYYPHQRWQFAGLRLARSR